MDDLLQEFLTETGESLSQLDLQLVQLERDPHQTGLLSNIFRLVHTIKGTCGFLGLPRLESVAHAGENVLGRFRDGELTVTPGAVSLILTAIDRIKLILDGLAANGTEPAGDDTALIAALNAAAAGEPIGIAAEPEALPGEMPATVPARSKPRARRQVKVKAALPAPAEAPETAASPTHPVAIAPEPSAPQVTHAAPAAEQTTASEAHAQQSIRVNVELLESLMTTVSELVLTRNQLLQIVRSDRNSEFAAPLQRLNQVVSELQEGVMKTRMQPIGNAWAKLPRIVRDLTVELGKKIQLDMIGAETELDRQVLELIKDPLTHMVRNAADHGIEMPDERVLAGKAETGHITLKAFHQGGHIIVEIADDGKGLNLVKIKAKILANKLASEADLAGLTEAQIQQYIFRAGFSTAEKVTSVSGRGVGMDVVRTNIEKIGGTIELNSKFGSGSTFTIKIPLTLAIVSALIVEAAGERYAVPQLSVVELVRASERPEAERRIERIRGARILRLRDQLLPLISLQEMLQLPPTASLAEADDRFIVVTQVGPQTFGVIVDRVFDTEEIVVKPVAPMVRHIPLFSGNTILGDGSVIMILDPNGLASAVGSLPVSAQAADNRERQARDNAADRTTLLVFRGGDGGPKAVPLSLVARLEEFDGASIETVSGQSVMQYRGRLTPLATVDGIPPVAAPGKRSALMFSNDNHVMALLVDEIVDIVETEIDLQLACDRPGIVGSTIIDGRATDLIDAAYFVTRAFPDWFGQGGRTLDYPEATRLLFVDDSAFFRNLVTPMLQVAGYDTRTVASAKEAMDLCEQGDRFDVIVSDLEMPGIDGFDFAGWVRQNAAWQQTPMLALSSLARATHLARAQASGFDDFITKFDRESFLAKLDEMVGFARRAA